MAPREPSRILPGTGSALGHLADIYSPPREVVLTPFAHLVHCLLASSVMNIAITTSNGRVAPCLTGVELRIVRPGEEVAQCPVLSTDGWAPLAWGGELGRADVGVLICSGIHRFIRGALRGRGIQVIANATGDPAAALKQCRSGHLTEPLRHIG